MVDDNSPDLIEKMCIEYIGYKQNGEHPWDNPDKRADDFAFHLRERMRRVLKVVEGDGSPRAAIETLRNELRLLLDTPGTDYRFIVANVIDALGEIATDRGDCAIEVGTHAGPLWLMDGKTRVCAKHKGYYETAYNDYSDIVWSRVDE